MKRCYKETLQQRLGRLFVRGHTARERAHSTTKEPQDWLVALRGRSQPLPVPAAQVTRMQQPPACPGDPSDSCLTGNAVHSEAAPLRRQ